VTLQSIGDGVITTDVRGRVTSLNGVAAALTGWNADEAAGQPLEAVFRIVDESTRETTPSPVAKALAEGTVVGLANHTILIARDGTERPIDDSAAPIRDAEGGIRGVVLVFRDGTERRRVERAQALLANVVELSEDAIVTKSLDGIVTSWNAGAERIFGYAREDMVGQPILRIFPPERVEEVRRILGAIGRGERVEHFESERIRKDGRRISVSLSVSPIRDGEGNVVGASKIARDITDRKRAELERQRTLRELTTLYAVGQAVSAAFDRERVLQTITDAATELSGARYGAFLHAGGPDGDGPTPFAISGASREAFAALGMPRTTQVFAPTFAGTHTVRVADIRSDPRYGHSAPHHGLPTGHPPVASYLAVPVINRDGEVFGGLFLGHPDPGVFSADDERVVVALAAQASIALQNARLYEAEQRARASAEQTSQEKDHFLAMLGHELRNPLAAVRNALSAAQLDPSRVERALAIASHGAEQLNRLVDDLLDVSRVTQGRLTLRREAVDLAVVVRQAVDAARALFDEHGVTPVVRVPADPCLVDGDPTRLEQVVGNLLTNAAKYSETGGQVLVAVEAAGDAALVRVSDAGIGIAPELLPRIFDLFVQGSQTLDRSRGGLGIGLRLVRQLVEMHGGSVTARSAGVGRGAEFVVRLPRHVAAPVPPVAAPPAPVASPAPTAARVLIVEDNAGTAESLRMLLEVFGFEVRAVGDGPAALAAVRAQAPDVMLVDIGLPGMDGYELARRIRADAAANGITLVALTGYGQEEDRRDAIAAGFDHHLVKPVDVEQVRRLLADVRGRPTPG
jgi:PAS domain S-box-containing protein